MMARSEAHKQSERMRRPWTPAEDLIIIEHMKRHDKLVRWEDVSKLSGLNRCGRSCRLRWTNYLSPNIKRGAFPQDEEAIIIDLQSVHGKKWALISTHLPGWTDSDIKNYWNTRGKKKVLAKENPLVTQRESQQVLATADWMASAANYPMSYAMKLDSDAQHPVLQGFGYVTPNSQTQLHELGVDSMVPASPEFLMTNQAEISNLPSTSTTFENLRELMDDEITYPHWGDFMDDETTYPYWGDFRLV